ncbi:MAG: type II secretion system F family protein [Phycisphaerales bacterium]|nr:type II secretion system F family protein [Phycisphaerales bacterium]
MPNYRFQVRSQDGKIQSGTMAADSATAAAAILRNQGVHVMAVDQDKGGKGAGSKFAELLAAANSSKPTQKHVLDFTTQLSVMIRAGINLRAALDGIADQTDHRLFKKVIEELKSDVESGRQFSDALARHPKLFGPLYINMVRASEMSGSFSEMLDRIGGYIAQQIETKKMVIGASIYPAIIGTMAVTVTIFLLTFVLPKFYTIFEGKEDVLPWATNFLMMLSQLFTDQWPFIIGGVAVIGGASFAFVKTEVGAFWVDKMKLTIPVLKTMFRSLYITRSLQTMGQLINAGVPMLDTLTITSEISGNKIFEGMWRKVHNSVKQGRKIAEPLQKDPILPKAVIQMISAGEESGKLGEVLDEISVFYAKQLKDHIRAVTGMIEPIMIILMGSVVGFIAMAIILPIFKMSQLVS